MALQASALLDACCVGGGSPWTNRKTTSKNPRKTKVEKRGLSRRGILNIMKGLWRESIGAAVILGREYDPPPSPSRSPACPARQRHHHDRRKPTPAAAAEVRRRDQGKRQGLDALVAAARRAAQGRAQRAAHHDRRPGLRGHRHIRRRHPDAGARPHRQCGPALHPIPLHRALLADARRADHRPQPPLRSASA